MGFVLVFAATGLGFGIALSGLFSDIDVFRQPTLVFRTLFDAINYQYDLSIFDGAGQNSSSIGVAVRTYVHTNVAVDEEKD